MAQQSKIPLKAMKAQCDPAFSTGTDCHAGSSKILGVKTPRIIVGCGDAYMDVGGRATQEAKDEVRTASITDHPDIEQGSRLMRLEIHVTTMAQYQLPSPSL